MKVIDVSQLATHHKLSLSPADSTSDATCISFVTEFRAHSRALIDLQVDPAAAPACYL